jgi:beta-glucosidase
MVSFEVKNTGARSGTEIAQVYVKLPSAGGEPFQRLVGWERVDLEPGASKRVSVKVDPEMLSIYDERKSGWTLLHGTYGVSVGASSAETPLRGTLRIH